MFKNNLNTGHGYLLKNNCAIRDDRTTLKLRQLQAKLKLRKEAKAAAAMK
jgi:hypothetical protein